MATLRVACTCKIHEHFSTVLHVKTAEYALSYMADIQVNSVNSNTQDMVYRLIVPLWLSRE